MNAQGDKKITIGDVAKQCGVSKTTVSRFLNGKYENISAETRQRIQQVISDLNYHPNKSAQRLKASRSMLIGCIIGDVGSPFSALLLKGIISECDKAGYQVLFANCNDDPEKESAAIQGFIANRVDGLIVNTSGGNEDNLLALQASGIPVVMADRSLCDPGLLDTVAVPNRDTAWKCVSLLKDFGYEHVAFFSEGNKLITPRIKRYEGYCAGVRELFGAEGEMYVFDRDDIDGCRSQLNRFRNKYPGQRIAIFSVNGVTTHRILLAFKESGLEIGYEYGLCGFDDWSWLQLAPPGITSVLNDSMRIGAEAAKLLLDRLSGRRDASAPAVLIEIPNEIVVRGSTVKEKM